MPPPEGDSLSAMRRALTVMLSVLVAGCGASDADRVATAFKHRLDAAVNRDYQRVCELTSPQHRGEMTDPPATSVTACAQSLRAHQDSVPITERQRQAVAKSEVVNVRIRGDHAQAFLDRDGCVDWGSEFRRDAAGHWQYDGALMTHRIQPCALERSSP